MRVRLFREVLGILRAFAFYERDRFFDRPNYKIENDQATDRGKDEELKKNKAKIAQIPIR